MKIGDKKLYFEDCLVKVYLQKQTSKKNSLHHRKNYKHLELNGVEYEKKPIFLNINTPCLYIVKPISVM